MWLVGIFTLVVICSLVYIGTTSHKDRPRLFKPFVDSYEKADRATEDQHYFAVFTGSSVMKFWSSLETDFLPLKVVNRAIPGTKINELCYFIDKLVTKYQPEKVFIYAGSNDIQGRKPRSAVDVLNGFKGIVRKIHEQRSETEIYYISIIVSPAKTRIRNRDEIEKANSEIEAFCSSVNNLRYIDLTRRFLNETGEPDENLFRPDKIHLTPDAYGIWKEEISKHL